MRQLVYRRDRWTCRICGNAPYPANPERRSGALHLDHIVPWSAGGTDRSDNLRTLCGPCNKQRSNFYSPQHDKPTMPIVRICAFCLCLDAGARPPQAFDVYCASRSHLSWALPGWQVL